jgi:branched-chain amino acid transport system substrate-binding protein
LIVIARLTAAALVLVLAGLAVACAGGDGGVEPVAAGSCGELLYEGEGEPDVIVVSDFPLRGEHAPYSHQMVDAIEHVLGKREFRAGERRVGYQSCSYTVGERLDASLCRRNARAYVDTTSVVGVIGPYNSGCAELQIPIVSRAAAGPLAMVSPANTDVRLTRGSDTRALYPDGVRSYARVITHDRAQGAATAQLARRLGARKVALVLQRNVDDPYVRANAAAFRAAAAPLGIESTSFEWPLREEYSELAASVAAERPNLVYLVGLPEQNAKRLVEDLRAALGPGVPFVAPDSFAADDIAEELGPVGEGFRVTVPGAPPGALPPAGERFLRDFGQEPVPPGTPPGAPEAAQAAEVLLDAIARSDGTRASIVEELFATRVEDGILGSFSFDRYGDIDPAPVGVYRFEGGDLVVDGVVRTPPGRER